MTTLAIEGLGKTYADGTEALRDMHIVAHSGDIVAILGGSGYTAVELIKILLRHPHAEIVAVTSRHEGTPLILSFLLLGCRACSR